jgi:malonyl-ACP decarboxylase
MREGRLHPTINLETPIDPSCQWVQHDAIPHTIEHALNLSMGFGGINTAVCLQRI